MMTKNASNVLSNREVSKQQLSVCFLPFWEPYLNYASSRLRGLFPARFLAEVPHIRSMVGWHSDADLYFVIQLASDSMLERLQSARNHAAIAYVVCDKHFDDDFSIAGVNVKHCFFDICGIADVFVVPTENLKSILEARVSGKPIFVIPDTQDYVDHLDPEPVPISNTVAWFGNPGKGNFESARPHLEYCIAQNFDIRIISRRSYFERLDAYRRYVVDWSYDGFVTNLRFASFCIISFESSEVGKSENRLVTSVMNGVPALVSGRESISAQMLIGNGLDWAVVSNSEELVSAIKKIQDKAWRAKYIHAMQAYFEKKIGIESIRNQYMGLIRTLFRDKAATAPVSEDRNG
jgi:hypothetical protein